METCPRIWRNIFLLRKTGKPIRSLRLARRASSHRMASPWVARNRPASSAFCSPLYALHAKSELPLLEPFRAFKEFPDSAPYVGAFASHTEQILVPAVHKIKTKTDLIMVRLSGEAAPTSFSGDFAFVVRPLPKIFLGYIFYEADADFPPSATCLYSNNANRFMPMDGLADVGEYTSKRILELIY